MTFYFAWVDPNTSFDEYAHSVEDEEVFAFELSHREGDFAMLSIDIKNPRTNLIGGGRKVWAWLSVDGTPLFYGRLVAIPEDLVQNIVRLNFIARPQGYETLKQALADTLKVAPYYDPIWLNQQKLDDPDTVLEARNSLWHIDRTTHVVSVSDINVGEDGTVNFLTDETFYDDVTVSYGATPLRRVTIQAQISWDQVAAGTLDFTRPLLKAFKDAGSPGNVVSSYTGQGLQQDRKSVV